MSISSQPNNSNSNHYSFGNESGDSINSGTEYTQGFDSGYQFEFDNQTNGKSDFEFDYASQIQNTENSINKQSFQNAGDRDRDEEFEQLFKPSEKSVDKQENPANGEDDQNSESENYSDSVEAFPTNDEDDSNDDDENIEESYVIVDDTVIKTERVSESTDEDEEDDDEDDDEEEDEDEEDETIDIPMGHVQKSKAWGYGFVIIILVTLFGSVTLSVWFILIETRVSVPSILVNTSIVSLLFFLLVIILRYVVLIFMSFFQHNRNRVIEFKLEPPFLKASILVPAYNEGVVIERSIRSLVELDYPNFEIIVIDDGSTDDTLEIALRLEGKHGNVQVKVVTQANGGKSAALNHGARVSDGDVVVCVDGDSRLHPLTLLMAMRHFENPEITGIAGNVKIVNRRNMLTRLQSLEYIEGLNLVRRGQALLRAVNIVPGPIGIFRREAVIDVGGWSSDTFAEDCDLTLKLLSKNYKIDYEPDAISYTEAPESLLPLLKQRYRWTRGILQAMRKHKALLIDASRGFRVLITMWQMIMESILWPLMNVMANVLFLVVGILFGMSPLLVLWWVQLTILDMIAAMYTVSIEREELYHVPYALLYRVFFVQIVDVAKLAATIEEMMGIKMGWGKLERTGS